MSGPDIFDKGRSVFVTAKDGLRLHVREYGALSAPGRPVVCLPGLSRTVCDFDALATALANGTNQSRRVIAIDSRGRGLSDYDSNPKNYNLAVELADIVTVLTVLAVGPAIFVGSSRGGILTMLLGVAHPDALAGVVLHDIGPVIELTGLARIRSYLGKIPQPGTFTEGAEILKHLFAPQFPKFTAEQWLTAARRAWRVRDGKFEPTYDIRLAQTLADFDGKEPLPSLWSEFDTLARLPMLVIRGANSDILSKTTLDAMAARHFGMQSIGVADEGHVPSLEGNLVDRISQFVSACGSTAQ